MMIRYLPHLTLLFAVLFALSPLASGGFNGFTPDQFPVVQHRWPVQPAGWAFSIWGLIYLWLIAHAGFGLFARRDKVQFTGPGLPLLAAVALGTLWLAIAGSFPILATVTILIMAALALTAFLIADPAQDRWLLSAPLAIFAGWLTAAAAVSTGVILAGYGLLSDTGAALTMLALVLAIALAVQSKCPRMPVYGATVVWAIIGIVVVNWGQNPTVAYSALAGAAIMATATLWHFKR